MPTPRAPSRTTVALLAAGVGVAALLPAPASRLLLVAPLAEEIVFRAGLQQALLQRLAPHAANLATAIVFAAAHLALAPGLPAALTLLPALALGAVYGRTRRLAPCVAGHALFNGVWLALA